MEKVLCLLVLFAAPLVAASAQTPPDAQPPGLTLDKLEWVSIGVTFTGFGGFDNSGGGGRGFHRAPNNSPPPNRAPYVTPNPHNWSPNSNLKFGGSNYFRAATVTLTNTGARTVRAVRLEFVFTDPATGAEVLRLKHRTTKKLKPGVTKLIRKEARASRRIRRGDDAQLSVEVTEVVYADGTSWRRS